MKLSDVTTGTEFEEYVRQILRSDGINTENTPASNDYGADLICFLPQKTVAIQCKFYAKAVGVKAVQEVIGSLSYYKADFGVVVTNSFFTQQASNLATSNHVLLIDGNSISTMLQLIIDFSNKNNDSFAEIDSLPEYESWNMKDLVIRYGVSSGKIYKDFLGNGLPYYKVGREYRFDPDQVIQWEIELKKIPFGKEEELILPGYLQFIEDLQHDFYMAKKEKDQSKIKEIKQLKRKYHILFLKDKIAIGVIVCLFCVLIAFCLFYFLKLN